jgi:uncharacterized membrane protein YkvI
METAATTWQRYFLPSVIFMSVVIGGGYATGRELVEFFMPAGPKGGLIGMAVTALVWSIVFAVSLELARTTQSFDYRSFFRQLLGRGWIAFEVVYLTLLMLILAVLGAASGEILSDMTGAPLWLGTVLFVGVIALLAWLGTAAIESFFSLWGIVLYAAYIVFFVMCLASFGERIESSWTSSATSGAISTRTWLIGGLTYAGYNIASAPALLFCARHQRHRREALLAGALAGPVAMIPGALFFVAMLARYPEIAQAPVPLQVLLRGLDSPWLAVGMQIAIFGTLVQTGIGVLHGFNERLTAAVPAAHDARIARNLRLIASVGLSVLAIVLATRIGLIDLIAKGYGYCAWVVIAVYVVPLLTLGVWRIWGSGRSGPDNVSAELQRGQSRSPSSIG